MLHVVGVFLAAWGTGLAAWRFLRDRDLVPQLLVVGVAIKVAVYVLSTKTNVVTQTREIAPVLPFAAALAGRRELAVPVANQARTRAAAARCPHAGHPPPAAGAVTATRLARSAAG
jgi:hypothetical protein